MTYVPRWLTASTKVIVSSAAVAALAWPCSAGTEPCTPGFASGFEMPGVNGPVHASIMYDAQDGNGPRLYIAGKFDRAGGKACNSIAMWDGTEFQPLGGGLLSSSLATAGSDTVYDLEVFDPDGDGPLTPELWAGGIIRRAKQTTGALLTTNGIARWNGAAQTWATVTLSGGSVQVYDLLADNHVSPEPQATDGPRIYLATNQGTGSSRYITAYRWNGSAYSQIFISNATGTPILNNIAWCMSKYNGQVYFGGHFTNGVHRITPAGNQHEKLPVNPAMALANVETNNFTSATLSMTVWNNRLLIGPEYTPTPMESFDGTSWAPAVFGEIGTTAFPAVEKMEVIDLGTGPKLYFGIPSGLAGGLIASYTGGAVWDGSTLSPLGHGVLNSFGEPGVISNFTKTTLRGQPVVFAGGTLEAGINTAGDFVQGKGGVFWNGSAWISQYDHPVNGGVYGSYTVKLDGVNERIIGTPTTAIAGFDAVNPTGILQYDGTAWSRSSIPAASAVANASYIRYNDGTGEALFAYGSTDGDTPRHNVRKWDTVSQTWVPISNDVDFDYPGVGNGSGLPNGFPRTAVVFDTDGAGSERPWLIIGGNSSPNDIFVTPPNIIAYTGTAWVSLGDGLADDAFNPEGYTPDSQIYSLVVFDDGNGPKLYASGRFRLPLMYNPTEFNTVARYDGVGSSGTWTVIGRANSGGFAETAARLRVLDVGNGPQLFAYGLFPDIDNGTPNATPTGEIARWTGTEWVGVNVSPLEKSHASSPFAANINDIAAFDDGSGVALYAVGSFGSIGGTPAMGIAKHNGSGWSPLGLGLNSHGDNLRMGPNSLVVFDGDGAGSAAPALYVAGAFDNANGTYSEKFARYNGCGAAPTCPADFNGDNTRDVADLFAYINAWLAKTANADFNDSGNVDVADLFAYINAWLAGC